jgi:calcium-dependent protein kinase
LQEFYDEVKILKDMDHPGILRLFEFYEDEDQIHIVTEICEGGDLFDYIVDTEFISEAMVSSIMEQTLAAVSYCHANNIVHRDLKPENLLLEAKPADPTDPLHIKVIDFGTATLAQGKLSQMKGTAMYMAPEMARKEKYDDRCDVWSCGVLLYVLLSGGPPFGGDSDAEIIAELKRGVVEFDPEDWADVSDDAKDLVLKMMDFNKGSRLTAE